MVSEIAIGICCKAIRGLPLITYASRGGGGVNTDAYKCVQGGRGGLNMTKNTHFVRRFMENATISKTFRARQQISRGIHSAHVNFISMICC